MDTISTSKVSCPGCGQHFQHDQSWAGRTLVCPHCACQFTVPANSEPAAPTDLNRPRCPKCEAPLPQEEDGQTAPACTQCGWQRNHASAHPRLPRTAAQKAVSAITLIILGALSPYAIVLAMAVTFVTGPLALVLAPLAALSLSAVMCRYVHERVGPKWYWLYVGAGTLVQAATLWAPSKNTAGNEAAFGFLIVGALGIVATVLWLICAIFVWIRALPEPF